MSGHPWTQCYSHPKRTSSDYILEIRQFIRKGIQAESPDKFFESVAFWQKAYKESEAEQAKLLNTIFELEQRTRGLHSKIKQSQSTGILSSKKRKATASESLKRSVPPRKAARDSKTTDENGDEEDSENETGLLMKPPRVIGIPLTRE